MWLLFQDMLARSPGMGSDDATRIAPPSPSSVFDQYVTRKAGLAASDDQAMSAVRAAKKVGLGDPAQAADLLERACDTLQQSGVDAAELQQIREKARTGDIYSASLLVHEVVQTQTRRLEEGIRGLDFKDVQWHVEREIQMASATLAQEFQHPAAGATHAAIVENAQHELAHLQEEYAELSRLSGGATPDATPVQIPPGAEVPQSPFAPCPEDAQGPIAPCPDSPAAPPAHEPSILDQIEERRVIS